MKCVSRDFSLYLGISISIVLQDKRLGMRRNRAGSVRVRGVRMRQGLVGRLLRLHAEHGDVHRAGLRRSLLWTRGLCLR